MPTTSCELPDPPELSLEEAFPSSVGDSLELSLPESLPFLESHGFSPDSPSSDSEFPSDDL
ncbi:hypothetical protein R0K20_26125, partial [Staphylococcus sp. SIMBA_130]